MVNIITDSTADLGSALLSRYNIDTIPLYVIMQGKSFVDGTEINNTDLFESVQETGQLPKTSAATIVGFQELFGRPGEQIYIGISSQLSATVRNAQIAAEQIEPDKVHIIDSLNLSSGIGLLALKAAQLRDAGVPAQEIAARITAWVPKVRTAFVIETLDYLYKGGRCSAMQNLMASLLRIRPIIAVQPDGTLNVREKVRGSRAKALAALLNNVKADLQQIDPQHLFVTHTGCDADAQHLKQEILALSPTSEIHITTAGSVIASHCGPDTIGIIYLLK